MQNSTTDDLRCIVSDISEKRKMFLEPETRCDTYISKEAKEAWKIRLDLLEYLMAFCEKHHLRWCMACGSLLGTIRHKGVIPWDEDLDVAMPRKDFEKLLELMPHDLEYPYFLQDYREKDYFHLLARLRHSETTEIDAWYAMHHWTVNMGIYIDIQPIDGIPDGRFKSRLYKMVMKNLITLYWGSMEKPPFYVNRLILFLKKTKLLRIINRKRLYKRIIKIANHYTIDNCQRCGLMPYRWESWKKYEWPSWCFKEYTEKEFEYLKVKVPTAFDKILTETYGDWHKMVKGASMHDGTFYVDSKHSYKDILPQLYSQYGYTKEDFK